MRKKNTIPKIRCYISDFSIDVKKDICKEVYKNILQFLGFGEIKSFIILDKYIENEILTQSFNFISPRAISIIFLDKYIICPKTDTTYFGITFVDKNVFVVSVKLLNDPNSKILYNRLSKVSFHELGHVFNLCHCSNNCVMNVSKDLNELDLSPTYYCDKCQRRIYEY